MAKFETLENQLCKELETLEQKFKGGANMTTQELDQVDKLLHAMKDLLTVRAMKEAEEYEQEGVSGYRGRAANGRYISRNSNQSYANGYSQGYSEAMNHMNRMSGNIPEPRPMW